MVNYFMGRIMEKTLKKISFLVDERYPDIQPSLTMRERKKKNPPPPFLSQSFPSSHSQPPIHTCFYVEISKYMLEIYWEKTESKQIPFLNTSFLILLVSFCPLRGVKRQIVSPFGASY